MVIISQIRKIFLAVLIISTVLVTCTGTSAVDPPYVILISLDGFRWDYLDRGITPNLNRLTETGVRALSLEPVFPSNTFPSHYSIVTGLYPQNHGIIANHFYHPRLGERFSMRDRNTVRDPRFYEGIAIWETLERHAVTTASYFWVGSDIDSKERRPTYFHHYDHERPDRDRIEGVIEWLLLPEEERPSFITLYFHEVDARGHRYGPDAEETNEAIKHIDQMIGILINRLDETGIMENVNIIIVSDHGMSETSPERIINIDRLLEDFEVRINGYGALSMIYPRRGQINRLYEHLQQNRTHFRVYTRESMPGYLNFSDHPAISPVIVLADPGWSLTRYDTPGDRMRFLLGSHGYEHTAADMHGIFIASGPMFRDGYSTGTLRVVDIYPLLCRMYGIEPEREIDGFLSRIEFILQD